MKILIILILVIVIVGIKLKSKFTKVIETDGNVGNSGNVKFIPNIIHKIYIDDSMEKTSIRPDILNAVKTWTDLNPNYTLKIWYGNEILDYLKNNFTQDHVDCFNSLKPYAYKADFFRYCIIYKEGGWYTDIQQKLLIPLDQINDKNYKYVLIRDSLGDPDNKLNSIQNGFFGSIKNNSFFKNAIDKCISNYKTKYYGKTGWDPTGPYLLGTIFKNIKINNEYLMGYVIHDKKDGPCYIIKDQKIIINKCCVDHNIPGTKLDKGNNYIELWNQKDIYQDKFTKSTFGKMKNNKICILITTCVYIKTKYYNQYNTPEIRLRGYIEIIDKWLNNTNLDIKIVESSNYKFLQYIDNPRVQVYSFKSNSLFKCNECDATPYEAESILLAFKNLNLKNYDIIIKITGKYYLPTFEKILDNIPYDHDLYFQYTSHPQIKQQNSEIFGCKTKHLENIMNLIIRNSESNMNFESTLYTLNNSKYKIYRFPKIKLDKPIRRSGNNSIIEYI